MRFAALIAAIVLLVGCSPSSNVELPLKSDGRFDLLQHNMLPVRVSDAKECHKVLSRASIFKFTITGPERDGFDMAVTVWNEIDRRFASKINGSDGVISAGRHVKNPELMPESLFPEGASTELKAEKCGEYAGQLQVEIGLMSLSDSVQMVLDMDPNFFETMGMSTEQILSGLQVINGQAANLSALTGEQKITCTAIYQGLALVEEGYKPYRSIWVAALVSSIENDSIDPMTISQKSEYWRVLSVSGAEDMSLLESYSDVASNCEAELNKAISKQAEEA